MDRVHVVAAVEDHLSRAGDARAARERVVAVEAGRDEPVARLVAGDPHLRGEAAEDEPAGRVVAQLERVGRGRSVRDDGVDGAVAAAARRVHVDVDRVQVGAREVADEDRVRAAERPQREPLDPVQVHGDPGDVARERAHGSRSQDLHVLGDVGAVEGERVGTALALDDVAAVARVPLERVVARAEQRGVGAAVAVDEVVAAAADQRVRAVAAEQGVVAVAAVERDGLVGEEPAALVDPELVVTAAGLARTPP